MPNIAFKFASDFAAADKGVYYAVNRDEIRL